MQSEDPSQWGFTPKIAGENSTNDTAFWASRFSSFGAVAQQELPNKITTITPENAARALSDGFYRITGKRPNAKVLGLLLAQWAIETGNGKYVHNWNFGNLKRYSGTPYFQYFRCSEIIDGTEVFFDRPAPECAFAAYLTPADGAEAYIKILMKRPHWWAGLLSGDIRTFNSALSTAPKYYTASPSLYLAGLQSRYDSYSKYAQRYGATRWATALQYGIGMGLVASVALVARKKLNG